MAIQHRTRTAALVVAALAANVLDVASAGAQTFPPEGDAWRPFVCTGSPMRDAVGDHPGAEGARDLVGTVQAPAGLRAADPDFLYLRLRLDQDPRQGPGLRAGSSWGFAFSVDGQSTGYEVLVTADGTTGMIAVHRNSSVSLPDSAEDPADSPAVARYSFATHGRVLAADSALGAGADVYLDMSVPWSALAMVGMAPETTIVTWAASSTTADRLNLDFACHDAGGGTGAPTLGDSASTGERAGPSSSGTGGTGGAGGGGGAGGAGGVELEGGPGCAVASPGSGEAGPFAALLLSLIAVALIRRPPKPPLRR
jgi:MYXO-CTERM domain-containing protein